ncbi:MAG: hypothetical protein HY912_24610 [Desulfomonile tiedjei]|uniref:VCBS repeat-containing protein n=1 Tax=Desulfomonile tiedjei TaxID=2358 RepID=A0A9D6Z651_9BACT|nr:hypothetical protein [Desulfomonile tiedjei]
MRRTIVCSVLILALSVAAATAQDRDESQISLIVPKCNMFPNPDLKSEDVLFGLFVSNIGHLLLPARITVTSGVDDRCDKFTKVDVSYPEVPLFLIRGLPDLKTGSIKTAFSGSKFIYPGQPVLLSLPDQEKGQMEVAPTMLRAFGNAVEHGKDTFVLSYKIELRAGDRNQTLDFYRNSPASRGSHARKFGVLNLTDHAVKFDLTRHMEVPTLIWAGDLDADGKIDLFMWWPCPGRTAGVYYLYLSSAAKDGDLVAKIPVGVRTYYCDPR